MKGLLLQDFDRCNETVNGINKKYGFKLWALGFARGYLPVYFLLYAVYLPLLLYKAMVLKAISLADVVVLWRRSAG